MGKLLSCISTPPDQRFGYCIKGIGTERLQYFGPTSRVKWTVRGYLIHKSQPIGIGCLRNFSDETGAYQTSPVIHKKQKRTTEMMRSIGKKL
ncbi:MAG: hypothetical protein ACRD47_08700 [Nitrososphaeraceae archaeon]